MGPSGGPITLDQTGVETYATVFTIAPSPRDGQTIWTGSDDGLVHVTRDGGKTWDNVTPKDLPEFARISLIEASPHSAGTAFVAANRYQRGGPRAVRLPDRRLRDVLDEDRGRSAGIRFRPHDPRGSVEGRPALPGHRARHLRVVQRRSLVAVAAPGPAGDAGARDRADREGSRHRDSWPVVLHPRQRRHPPAVHARRRLGASPSVRAGGRGALRRPRRAGGLLPEERRRKGGHRDPRRERAGGQHATAASPRKKARSPRRRRRRRSSSGRRRRACR